MKLPLELATTRTRDIGPRLKARFGQRVRKISLRIDASCPNRDGKLGRGGCIFCAEGDGAEHGTGITRLAALERSLEYQPRGGPVIAYLGDHSATYLPAEELDLILGRIREFPELVGIHIGTRPDCLPPPILEVLGRHGSETEILVELGLQSAREETLAFLRRRHTLKSFDQAVQLLRGTGIKVCAHVILGLPTAEGSREGPRAAVATARHLASLQVQAVKIHNCHVLRGTALAALHARGEYAPPELDGYLRRLIPFLEHLPPAVEVHRLMSDARPPRLIAPRFTAHKGATLLRIRQELARLDTWQGRLA